MESRRIFLETAIGTGAALAAASSTSALALSKTSDPAMPARPIGEQIVVLAWISFGRPVDEAIRCEMTALAAATRQEAGCLIYELAVDLADPYRVRLLERWASYTALEAHFRTPHMRTFRAGLTRFPSLTSGINVFEVSQALDFKAPPIG